MNPLKLISLALIVLSTFSCQTMYVPPHLPQHATTSLYGKTLEPIRGKENYYKLKVYTGGTAGTKHATQVAESEIERWMVGKEYASYEITKTRYVPFPISHVYFEIKMASGKN